MYVAVRFPSACRARAASQRAGGGLQHLHARGVLVGCDVHLVNPGKDSTDPELATVERKNAGNKRICRYAFLSAFFYFKNILQVQYYGC